MSRTGELTRLVSSWETGARFREHVRETNGAHTFLYRAPAGDSSSSELEIGELVSVSVRFVDRDTDFHVHAHVVARVEDGLTLAFLPEERDRQELVLATADGESIPYLRRKAVRTPCRLEVHVTLEDGNAFDGVLSIISERGAQLSQSALGTDTRLQLEIVFPTQRVHVAGRVTGTIRGPQDGAGIEFLFGSAKQRDAVSAAVTAFRSGTR